MDRFLGGPIQLKEDDDDKPWKVVKTNPREVDVQKRAQYSFRTHTEKKTVHDLEVRHPTTGEPIFALKPKSYGKGYNMAWHPYMTSQYPDLERSHEHGSRHPDPKRMDVDSMDTAKYRAKHLYLDAARGGFKDTLHVTTEPRPTEGSPHRVVNNYHDPDTGEKIGTAANDMGSHTKLSVSGDYLKNHGIDRGMLPGLRGSPYEVAKTLHGEKGKSYTALGNQHFVAKAVARHSGKYESVSGSPTVTTYKAGAGKTDAEVSSAHEAKVRAEHGHREGFTLDRHAPNVFTSGHQEKYEARGQRLTSVAHQGTLTVHQHDPLYHEGEAHSTKF